MVASTPKKSKRPKSSATGVKKNRKRSVEGTNAIQKQNQQETIQNDQEELPSSSSDAELNGNLSELSQANGNTTNKKIIDTLNEQPKFNFKNTEKVLILSARGITFRYRHLMTDLLQILPHSKRDSKLDTKNDRKVINEIAEIKSCSLVLFFECRKKQDLFLWISKAPAGPCFKFHVTNIHTMAELKLSGNHLKGSRPILSFDAAFDQQPHWQLCKELLIQTFATPVKHQKSKPFIDHVISFSLADDRIWLRNYQVLVTSAKETPTLMEVGPRCCLQLVRVFGGSFGGAVLYENPQYVSPNALRSAARQEAGKKYAVKVAAKKKRAEWKSENKVPKDELKEIFK